MNLSIYDQIIPLTLGSGFKAGPVDEAAGRIIPTCVCVEAPNGRYKVLVSISAGQDVADALLFSNYRRLLWRGSLRAGQTVEVTALCIVHPYLPERADEPEDCAGIELALAAPGASIQSVRAVPVNTPALILMGDSTVTDQSTMSPYAPGATYSGWGQMLPAYLGESACVGNFARSGMTVETFRTDGLYELMKTQIQSGDLVLMQFGHNDQKRANLTADGGYAKALQTYISELQAMGAKPIMVTPIARNSWLNDREYFDLLQPFAQAAKRVAACSGIPLIDLHSFMKQYITQMGRDAVKVFFHIGDYTHTNDFGAYKAAGFISNELVKHGFIRSENLEEWTPYPPYSVLVADKNDEVLPPTGLEAIYAGYETTNPDALLTRFEALELVNRTCGLFSHNGEIPLPDDVPQCEAWTDNVRCALQNQIILQDMLADGKLHRHRTISMEDFIRILNRGYAMRGKTDMLPQNLKGSVTRKEAAALCRMVKI